MYSQNQNNFSAYPPPPPPTTGMSSDPPAGAPVATQEKYVDGGIPDTAFVDTPVFIVCPNCNYKGNTRVDRVRGCTSFWCLFCCCMSLCSDVCSDYQHACPQCKVILGTYQMV